MDNKFAILKFAEGIKTESNNEKKKFSLLIKFIFKRSENVKHEIKIVDTNIMDADGYIVTIPITKGQALDDEFDEYKKVFDNLFDELHNRDVSIVTVPDWFKYKYDDIIPCCSGFYPLVFFIMEMSLKALKIKDIRHQKSEFLIIDGLSDLTEEVLYLLHENVNFLSVVTNETEYFNDIISKIYNENGLNIQMISEVNSYVKSADVIINCSLSEDNYDYYYKKGSIFFDLAGNKKGMSALQRKRGDMLIADGISLKYKDKFIDNKTLEAILYCTLNEFRKYLNGRFNLDDFLKIRQLINEKEFSINSFTCNGIRLS